jgi:hypothetical protein
LSYMEPRNKEKRDNRGHLEISSGDPQRRRSHDHDLERIAKHCDRLPEVERGMTECRRRSVTSAGDRATAVTGIRRGTVYPSKSKLSLSKETPVLDWKVVSSLSLEGQFDCTVHSRTEFYHLQ